MNKKQILFLHIIVFIMSAAFFMVVPIMGNELMHNRKIMVSLVALILNFRVISQDFLMLPAGHITDLIGEKNSLIISSFIRGLGFFLLFFDGSVTLLFISGLLIGVGGSFFFPAILSLYSSISNDKNISKNFAIREMLNSLGNIVGPLIANVLFVFGFKYISLVASLLFFSCSLIVLIMFKNNTKNTYYKKEKIQITKNLVSVFKDKRFVLFSLFLMIITIFMNQFTITIPLRVDQINPNYKYIGVIFSVSSTISAILQIHLSQFISKHLSHYKIVTLSMLLYVVGLSIMGFIDHINAIYIGAIVYSIGMLLFFPSKNLLTAKYAPKNKIGLYSGFQGLINTFGTIFISTGFGALYEISYNINFRFLPWIILLIGGLITVFILLFNESKIQPYTKTELHI